MFARTAACALLCTASFASAQVRFDGEKKETPPKEDGPAGLARARAESFLKALAPAKLQCSKAKKSADHSCDQCRWGVKTAAFERVQAEYFATDPSRTDILTGLRGGPLADGTHRYLTWRPCYVLLPVMVERYVVKRVNVVRDRVLVFVQSTGLSAPNVLRSGDDVQTWIIREGKARLDPSLREVGEQLVDSPLWADTVSIPGFFASLRRADDEVRDAGTTVAKEDAEARRQAFLTTTRVADGGFVHDVQPQKNKAGEPIPGKFWVIIWSGSIKVNLLVEGTREELVKLEKYSWLLFSGKRWSDPEWPWKGDPKLEAADANWTLNLEGVVRAGG